MNKNQYANGQIIYEQKSDMLTYFFKNGKIRAQGLSINGEMEGEWKFYRETGQLWQVGHFRQGQKNGPWVRYDKKDQPEYTETFELGKLVKM